MSLAGPTSIRPRLTLADAYGPGLLLVARPSARAFGWVCRDLSDANALTGCQLPIAGSMAVVASRGAATGPGLALLRDAGLALPPRLEIYDGEEGYLDLLRRLAAGGARFVVQHVHPPDEIEPGAYWAPRDLVALLNSKLHLGDLVPEAHAPRREAVGSAALPHLERRLPFAVKAATTDPTGAGVDVVVCRRHEDLELAVARFRGLDTVLVEEILEMRRNLCLHFAATAAGSATYLGSTDQVSDARGAFRGNWIGGDPAPPAAVALGREVAARGATLGYRGLVGIDIALPREGPPVAYDLNFRVCGSTAPLLLFEAAKGPGAVGRSRWWSGRGTFPGLVRAARDALSAGGFLPIATFDPAAAGHAGRRPRIFGLVFGESREAVLDRERDLAARGLEA